jgi:hypothetical protein
MTSSDRSTSASTLKSSGPGTTGGWGGLGEDCNTRTDAGWAGCRGVGQGPGRCGRGGTGETGAGGTEWRRDGAWRGVGAGVLTGAQTALYRVIAVAAVGTRRRPGRRAPRRKRVAWRGTEAAQRPHRGGGCR